MDLSIGDTVFYTRSNGLRPPATVVGTAEDGLLHLEYYQMVESGKSAMQDGVHLLCRPKFRLATSLPSISAAHTVKFPPKGPWSFTTATRTGKVPLKVPSNPVWV